MRPKFTYGHDLSPYRYEKDEILHREGEWFLHVAPANEHEWKSYVHHRVEKNIVQQNPWTNGQRPDPLTYLKKIGCEWADLPLEYPRCSKCLNSMPEGIIGLWVLHNWDSIQKTNATGRRG